MDSYIHRYEYISGRMAHELEQILPFIFFRRIKPCMSFDLRRMTVPVGLQVGSCAPPSLVNEHRKVGDVSIRSTNDAPSREGCVVNDRRLPVRTYSCYVNFLFSVTGARTVKMANDSGFVG